MLLIMCLTVLGRENQMVFFSKTLHLYDTFLRENIMGKKVGFEQLKHNF